MVLSRYYDLQGDPERVADPISPKGREEQLLVLDVSQPKALQDLSEFLGVECPQSAFPHVNTKEQKNSWVSPISGLTRIFKFKN